MQKNSVVTQKMAGHKTSSGQETCPKCGGTDIERRSLNVKACAKCGTEPWEKDPSREH